MVYKTLEFIWKYRLWAFLLGVVALVPKLIAVWRYFRHRWRDRPVFDVLDERVPKDSIYGGKEYYPYSEREIARDLGRSEESVLGSLKRLKKGKTGDRVVQADNGWYSEHNARPN